MFKLLDIFKKGTLGTRFSLSNSFVYQKYTSFKRLLVSNNQALEIIADLENIVYQDKPFTLRHVLNQSEVLAAKVFAIVEDLNSLTGVHYPQLFDIAEKISGKVFDELKKKKEFAETRPVIELEQLSLENANDVGGKAANLGEVYNRVHLPVPAGFAVTAHACLRFLEHNHLTDLIDTAVGLLDVNDTDTLNLVSKNIQEKIREAELHMELEENMIRAFLDLKTKAGKDIRLAVRSSATSEDSEASFAGQHTSVLNVSEKNLFQAYKEVVASAYSPRAIFYRRCKGYRDQDVMMSVACIMMVDAEVSGVLYTVDPNDSRNPVMMISAVLGLAAGLVDGSTTSDFYKVNKKTGEIVSMEIADQKTLLRSDSADGLKEESVSEETAGRPCLNPDHIRQLVEYALKLEDHYGQALDIEWAIDRNGKLYIIQTRPLKRSKKIFISDDSSSADMEKLPPVSDYPVLLKGGVSASCGSASGPAYILHSDHNLHQIPQDAILIVRQTSPRYVPLMGLVKAFVTDIGSVTGHMASVAREFQIPTLVGTGNATSIIEHGLEITVDAGNNIVYRGRVERLLKKKSSVNPMKGSPVDLVTRSALKWIAPLNLVDPKNENFTPEGCRTLHDIIRFAHEMSMQSMFRISDEFGTEKNIAIPLRVYLPLNVFVIDLGGGLSVGQDAKFAVIDDVTCIPLKALLSGMKHKDVDWSRDVGVSLGGLTSIFMESIIRDPMTEGRMGGPNYAVISKRYLNFNTRLGYHFTTIDTFCGDVVNDNYITFYFKGGAADIGRRSRRAILISLILKRMGFKVELTGDMVRGDLKKFDRKTTCETLDMLGRLLGAVRLLDMVLSDDGMVEWYVDQFFRGNYSFEQKTHAG